MILTNFYYKADCPLDSASHSDGLWVLGCLSCWQKHRPAAFQLQLGNAIWQAQSHKQTGVMQVTRRSLYCTLHATLSRTLNLSKAWYHHELSACDSPHTVYHPGLKELQDSLNPQHDHREIISQNNLEWPDCRNWKYL